MAEKRCTQSFDPCYDRGCVFAKILMHKRMAIGMSFSISSKFSIDNRKGMTTYFPSIIIVIYKATNMNLERWKDEI